jgi:hypothetical protein
MRKRQFFKVTHVLTTGKMYVYNFQCGRWADIYRMTKDSKTESVKIQRLSCTETEFDQMFND